MEVDSKQDGGFQALSRASSTSPFSQCWWPRMIGRGKLQCRGYVDRQGISYWQKGGNKVHFKS